MRLGDLPNQPRAKLAAMALVESKMTARIALEAVWKVPALRLRRGG